MVEETTVGERTRHNMGRSQLGGSQMGGGGEVVICAGWDCGW